MRRKRAAGLLLICIIVLSAIILWNIADRWKADSFPYAYDNRIMGIFVVQAEDCLLGKEQKSSTVNPGIYYEGAMLPYDESGVLYLSQNRESGWEGMLSVQAEDGGDYYLCMPRDAYLEQKEAAIRDNHSFTLWMVGDDCYYELELIVSGMPVVSMQHSRVEEAEEVEYEVDPDKKYYGSETLYYGTLEVFNPGVNIEGYEILQSGVCYHEKGGMTDTYGKRSYSLSVQDSREKNVDVSLLGMREDNTWKLNSLATDKNRIREITASQLWEQFDAANEAVEEPGPRMEYVELLVDNRYQGLYCLVEPVDEKKLNLDKGDSLYKIVGNSIPPDEDIQISVDKQWKIYDSIRVRYPKNISDYGTAWAPIRDYLNLFYRGGQVPKEALAKVDISNLVDNFLFLSVGSVSDNCFKNNYYAARAQSDGGYRMYRIPWDLDLSFGNIFDVNAPGMVRYEEDYTIVYEVEELSRLYETQPELIGGIMQSRWQEYRTGFLGTEAITQLLESNLEYLIDTGAIRREQECWPEEEISTDIEYLLDYQTKRMEWLDAELAKW